MKKRAFDADEVDDAREQSAPADASSPERTEPAPRARTAIGLVLLSWLVPLGMLVSLLSYSEGEPGTQVLHRVLTVVSVGLLASGLALAVRALVTARRDPRIRQRLAVAGLLLSLLTPVVWASELMFAWQMFLTREELDSQLDASSSDAE